MKDVRLIQNIRDKSIMDIVKFHGRGTKKQYTEVVGQIHIDAFDNACDIEQLQRYGQLELDAFEPTIIL